MYTFIVNPNARSGLGHKVWKDIERSLEDRGTDYQAYLTKYQRHATSIARELTCDRKPCTLIVLGGDGTVNEVMNGITDLSQVTFGYIPIGSSNDFARGLGLSTDPLTALGHILAPSKYTYINVGAMSYQGKRRRFAVSTGIGFDAGGSDRKVSAVVDGVPVYSEEVVWFPKTNADPDYHFEGILSAFRTAASKMPRVDAIGVSSAGIYVDNRAMVASLFLKVPRDLFDQKVKDIYIRAAKELGDIPLEVANDGDVTALAGAMSLEENRVLGIAMGTSEAAGYVDTDGNITGWLNELAFAPVDLQDDAMVDEWSGDKGCGVKYFSQDSVIKLAPRAGIALDESLSPAEKLKVVQKEMEEGRESARDIYRSIGVYLGHALAYYAMYYSIAHVLLLGRVMSGEGGDLVIAEARRVLDEEYPEYAAMELHLPDEKIRRVGQSVAAASLPQID